MPELPEVEIYRRQLSAHGLHRAVRRAQLDASVVKEGSARSLRSRLKGTELVSTRRHGKNLFAEIAKGGWLLLHFGMTGDLSFPHDPNDRPRSTRLLLEFRDGGAMAFEDMRKLGKVGLVEDIDEYLVRKRLGPDAGASSFGVDELGKALEGRSGSIKSVLMNQEVLAGVGNLYADETLFHAGVHPEARANRLRSPSVTAIHRAMKHVLELAIARHVDTGRLPRSWMLPHREKGGRCPKCGRDWSRTTIGGRTTYFCADHQRKRR